MTNEEREALLSDLRGDMEAPLTPEEWEEYTKEPLDAELKEAISGSEAELEALLGRGATRIPRPLTFMSDARAWLAYLYEQMRVMRLEEGGAIDLEEELLLMELDGIKEAEDSDIRATRKKYKQVNELRASLEWQARAMGGKVDRIICEIMPRWLALLDAALAEELSKRRKAKKDAKIEAAEKAFFDSNPYGGMFREQYADRKTRELYLPIPQNIPILECLTAPFTARNSELTENGDTLVRAGRGYSYLILAEDRRDEKTGELIELTQNRSLNAILTLLFVLLQWARQRDSLDPKLPRVLVPIDEFMALRGLTDEQNARIQLASGLQINQCTTIPMTDEKGLGKAYQLLQSRNVPKRGNKAEAALSADFHDALSQWYDNMMPLPLSLLKLNTEYDGLTLVAGLQLAWNQFYYYDEPRGDFGVKGGELARLAEPLLPSKESLKEKGRHHRQQRIDPIFNAVSRLAANLKNTAANVGLYRLSDGKAAQAGDDFNAICLTAATTKEEEEAAAKQGEEAQRWKSYPDISAERKEARAARNNKRKAGKK